MASTFFGLNISTSGLFASQKALQVTSHNIANANTEGYTRQRVDMHAFRPDQLPGSKGTVGVGVDTDAVKQIRNEYLDYSYRTETSTLGEWGTRNDTLSSIEAIFNEPSKSGVTEVLNDYFSSLQELNKNPESLTTRALVRQRSIALAANLNGMYNRLEKLQRDTNFELKVSTVDMNGYAKEIAKLNQIIYESELEGGMANDVRDQRNLLVDKMSELADINYYEDDSNRFHISISGHEIVNHYNYDELELIEREEKLNESDTDKIMDLQWKSGADFSTNSGKLSGIIKMRDNISGDDKGIPYYMDKLNEFVDTLVTEINMVHSQGYDLDANSGTNLFTVNGMSTEEYNQNLITLGLNGGASFEITSIVETGTLDSNTYEENRDIIHQNISDFKENNPEYASKSIKFINGAYYVTDRVKADEITISSDIENSLNKISASATAAGAPGDATNILRVADIRNDVKLYDWGSPDDFVKSLISNLAVDTKESLRVYENQALMVKQIVANKESTSGVSLDEEMASMVQFQASYGANARMITAMDEMLDILINRLGLVGR